MFFLHHFFLWTHKILHHKNFSCEMVSIEFVVCVPNDCKLQSLILTSASSFGFKRGHGDAVVTHSPPTCEVCGSNPEHYVGKMVVSYQWSAVYSTEPWPTPSTGFLCLLNCLSWYDLYSVESNLTTQINLKFLGFSNIEN